MRLLDAHSGQFVDRDSKDKKTVYAILSHTWNPKGEQTFGELREIQKRYAQKSSESPVDDGKPTFPHVHTIFKRLTMTTVFHTTYSRRRLSH